MVRKDIVTRVLADGSQLTIPVFYFKGSDPLAKKVYIQSGIHGSEIQGYVIALKLIEWLSQHRPYGDITIVPLANPYASNIKMGESTFGRFDPVTGENWNRNYLDLSFLAEDVLNENKNIEFSKIVPLFKEKMVNHLEEILKNESCNYAKKLALQLQKMALMADVVLDLHCDTISVPHIYSPSYSIESAINFSIPYIVEIPQKFSHALDEACFCPWLSLIKKYNVYYKTNYSSPMEAFTIELGGQEVINEKLADQCLQSIVNFLLKKGLIDDSMKRDMGQQNIYICDLKNFQTIYAPSGGILIQCAGPGTVLKENNLLFTLHNFNYNKFLSIEHENDFGCLKKSVYANEHSIVITRSSSSIVHEGMAMMKIMTKSKIKVLSF